MNKARRKQVAELTTAVDKVKSDLYNLHEDATNIAAEEREAFDNMNPGLQASPTGQDIEEAADTLDEAGGELDEALSSLARAIELLESV